MDLMGNATMLLDETYFRLRDHLGLAPIPPVRSGTTANYYDERILECFDIDFRRVFLKQSPQSRPTVHNDGSFTDIWGVRWMRVEPHVHVVEHPLSSKTTVGEIQAYPWPQPQDMFIVEGLAEQARRMYEETDYALVARNPLTAGFLDRAMEMMGMAQFLMALALTPDVARCIIDNLLACYLGVYGMFLDAVGPYVQMVETSDDLGTQQSLLLSPPMYRKFLKPAEKELNALIRAKAPQAAIFRHTDGAVFQLIPDLIDAGVEASTQLRPRPRGWLRVT
jgi:uroporphyrinogen decarboxylase